jgi:hypothetical protein
MRWSIPNFLAAALLVTLEATAGEDPGLLPALPDVSEPILAFGFDLTEPAPPAFEPIDLRRYEAPRLERPESWQAFMRGRYGLASLRREASWISSPLGWDVGKPTTPVGSCKPPRVTLVRPNGEQERVELLDCDGAVTADAVDRVSVIARPVGVARPELPLPAQPDPTASDGEWIAGVKLVHPRLIWALSQIAKRYPGRIVYVVSGYRRQIQPSFHTKGRALDLRVVGVTNESLFAFCRSLPDVGCGYYPNSTFVHVDVRPLEAGHALWVDISGPGEPAEYVNSWPGVVEPRFGTRVKQP